MPSQIYSKHFAMSSLTVIVQFCLRPNDVLADEESLPTESANRNTSNTNQNEQTLALEDIVVTATANPLTSMRSSVSVSILDDEEIQESVADNAADILRNIPGLIVQASGGEGNANISARGLPISGGAKLTQFQEDGLPILDFGDIDFATADTFLRADYNIERIEAIRGGTAATFASNAPGGIFNFISKTGEIEDGKISVSRGFNSDRSRLDFHYGKPLNEDWRFHIGGHYRYGEGIRTIGYTGEDGGQVKANITRTFDNGYIRFNFKWLNDRTPVYLPIPLSITGSESNPHISSLPNFDVLNGAMQSKYFRHDLSVNSNGEVVKTDIADGYYSNSKAFGIEAAFDFEEGWKFSNKFRIATTTGIFAGPYPAQVDTASALATSIGGAGATLRYATGPNAGQTISNPDSLNGNGLAVRTHLFNTTLNDLGNFANDTQLTKTINNKDLGKTDVTLGFFKSRQRIKEDWHWNTYLLEVNGKDAALLDVVDNLGNVVTQNGLVAYGTPFWGNVCCRSYDLTYQTNAPYAVVNWQKDKLNLDGSLRYDISRASGDYATSTGTTALDVNGDGILQTPEQSVLIVNQAAAMPVNYTVRYFSYSFGSNYLITPDLAVFARVSEGGRANAERVLFGGGINADGSIAQDVAVNTVKQAEAGVKWRSNHASVFATLFHATTKVTDQDVTSTTNRFTSKVYEANGLELEGSYFLDRFSLRGGLTYTLGKVVKNDKEPEKVGQQVNQRLMYQLTPAWHAFNYSIGLNIIGTSRVPFEGGISAPSYTQVNGFADYRFDKNLKLVVTANNIFNTIGITELPNASAGITANGVNTGRSINGRSINATLVYTY